MEEAPVSVRFNGLEFIRFPNSRSRSGRVYYTAYVKGQRAKGVGQLHAEVWKHVHGVDRVPEGHHIHHVDHNSFNNAPDNLVCLNPSQHGREHADLWRTPEHLAHLESIRPLAAVWHST